MTIRGLCVAGLLFVGAAVPAGGQCTDGDTDGFFYESGCGTPLDCNDTAVAINPGAPEVCNALDNDCSGTPDDDPLCDSTCTAAQAQPGVSLTDSPLFGEDNPRVVWNGAEYGVSWTTPDIIFTRVDAAGNPIGEQMLVAETDQDSAGNLVSVWSGEEYAFGWVTPGFEMNVLRATAAGSPIGTPLSIGYGFSVSLVANGNGYAFAWTAYDVGTSSFGDVKLVFIDRSGNKIGSDMTLVSESGYSKLVWSGSEYGLTHRNLQTPAQITFRRLDSSGTVIGTPAEVRQCAEHCWVESAVWTGSQYAVVWRESSDLHLTRLNNAGQVIDTARLTNATESDSDTSVVWTGAEYGMAWFRTGGAGMLFAVFDAAGARIGDEIPLAGGNEPRLAWNGTTYGVVYRDGDVQFAGITCDCIDSDGDGASRCESDCDDGDARVYPDAAEVCDGVNNDCNAPGWPALPPDETDEDGDTFSECDGDCDDAAADTYPGAAQLCDGKDNDCDSPDWPAAPPDEVDGDADTFSTCAGDCDDSDPSRFPTATEICNAIDDDCDTLIDEDADGEDTDADGVFNLCDNCPQTFNGNQFDEDADGVGNSCDNCLVTPNPEQLDPDGDALGDVCDNCPQDANPTQGNLDDDPAGDACDCALTDSEVYPGAAEINDAKDNQCPGDVGFGVIDETSGDSGFHNPSDNREYSWTPQAGATGYEVARSDGADFAGACLTFTTANTFWVDSDLPTTAGVAFFYLNRPVGPNPGSWGHDSLGSERAGVCP